MKNKIKLTYNNMKEYIDEIPVYYDSYTYNIDLNYNDVKEYYNLTEITKPLASYYKDDKFITWLKKKYFNEAVYSAAYQEVCSFADFICKTSE